MQIQSQVGNLQTDLAKTDKTINDALARIQPIIKKDKKKKGKGKNK